MTATIGVRTFLRRLIGAATLDAATYEELESDRRATAQASAIVVLSSLAAGTDVGELLRTIGLASTPGLLRVFGALPGLTVPVFVVTTVWMLLTRPVASSAIASSRISDSDSSLNFFAITRQHQPLGQDICPGMTRHRRDLSAQSRSQR